VRHVVLVENIRGESFSVGVTETEVHQSFHREHSCTRLGYVQSVVTVKPQCPEVGHRPEGVISDVRQAVGSKIQAEQVCDVREEPGAVDGSQFIVSKDERVDVGRKCGDVRQISVVPRTVGHGAGTLAKAVAARCSRERARSDGVGVIVSLPVLTTSLGGAALWRIGDGVEVVTVFTASASSGVPLYVFSAFPRYAAMSAAHGPFWQRSFFKSATPRTGRRVGKRSGWVQRDRRRVSPRQFPPEGSSGTERLQTCV